MESVKCPVHVLAACLFAVMLLTLVPFRQASAEDTELEKYVGMSVLDAKTAAESQGLDPRFRSSDGMDVTGLVAADGNGSGISKAKVLSADRGRHLFGLDSADFVLDYSVEEELRSCIGLSAEKAYAMAMVRFFHPVFISISGVDVTKEINGESSVREAKDAKVIGSEVEKGLFGGSHAKLVLDYESDAQKSEYKSKQKPGLAGLSLGQAAELSRLSVTAGKDVEDVPGSGCVLVPVKIAAKGDVTVRYTDFNVPESERPKDDANGGRNARKKISDDEIDDEVKLSSGQVLETVVCVPRDARRLVYYSKDEGAASWKIVLPEDVVEVNRSNWDKQPIGTRVRLEGRFGYLRAQGEYTGPALLELYWPDDEKGVETIRCYITDEQYKQLKGAQETILSDKNWDGYTNINYVRLEGRLASTEHEYEEIGQTAHEPSLDEIEILDIR